MTPGSAATPAPRLHASVTPCRPRAGDKVPRQSEARMQAPQRNSLTSLRPASRGYLPVPRPFRP
eukprot:scaffold179852_cov32-Tisochrysis_lutea.AAC.3